MPFSRFPGGGTGFPVAERRSRSLDAFPAWSDAVPARFAGVPGQNTQPPGLAFAVPGRPDAFPAGRTAFPHGPDGLPGSPDAVPAWLDAVPGQNDRLSRFADAVPAWPDAVPGRSVAIPGASGAVAARWSSAPVAYPRLAIRRFWFIVRHAMKDFLKAHFAKLFLFLALALLPAVGGARAAETNSNSLVWNKAAGRVDADLHGEPLWPLLEDIAHQTGWHIFVEPGTARDASTKFKDLPPTDALRMLLGELNFAFVPQTNGPDLLYVFTTSKGNATQPVQWEKPVVKKQRHVANELIVKLKPGADIDALAKLLGAKITARLDKMGIYRLEFADAAATDAALAKLQGDSDVVSVDYNYIFDPPPAPQVVANPPPNNTPTLTLDQSTPNDPCTKHRRIRAKLRKW